MDGASQGSQANHGNGVVYIHESDGRDIGDALTVIASVILLLVGDGWSERGLACLMVVFVVFQRRFRTLVDARLARMETRFQEMYLRVDGLATTVSEQWQSLQKEMDNLRRELRLSATPVPVPQSVPERRRPARFHWGIAAPLILFFCTLNGVLLRALNHEIAASNDHYQGVHARLQELEHAASQNRMRVEAVTALGQELNNWMSVQIAQSLRTACGPNGEEGNALSVAATAHESLPDNAIARMFPEPDLTEARAQLLR